MNKGKEIPCDGNGNVKGAYSKLTKVNNVYKLPKITLTSLALSP